MADQSIETHIIPLPQHCGIGFTASKPIPSSHYYQQVGRYHNYKVNPKSFRWPIEYPAEPNKVIDGFSPNVNKELHIGHLRNLALANALAGINKNDKFVAMLGYSLGEKPGAVSNLMDWFKFVGYDPTIYRDIDLQLPSEYLAEGIGEFVGALVWNGPKGPVLMKRSDAHETHPGKYTYSYHELAFANIVKPTHIITGLEQKEHFESLGMQNKHLPMGLVLSWSGKKMQSRDGTAFSATDTMNAIMAKLKPTPYPKELAWNILAWNFLRISREKNVKFSASDWTDPDSGGLYITYTYARIYKALINAVKYWVTDFKSNPFQNHVEHSDLKESDIELIGFAEYFHYYVHLSQKRMDPAPLANYLYELANKLSHAYVTEKFTDMRDGFITSVQFAVHYLEKGMNMLGMHILTEV